MQSGYSKKQISEILKYKDDIFKLNKHRDTIEKKHIESVKKWESDLIKYQSQCSHPHTFLTAGGQYEPQQKICSICDKEL